MIKKNRPDILFFMTDHERADVIGMEQCGREVTPNLNRLAKTGLQFDRAYNTCPLCVPARTALATGLYPTRNGVVFNDWKGIRAGAWEPMHTSLKKAGYFVGHVGVDHIRVKPPMREQGYDYFINQEDYQRWAEERGIETVRGREELREVSEEVEGCAVKKQYSSHKTSLWDKPLKEFKDFYFLDKALEFIKKLPEKPFALFTYLWAPHPPLKVPEPYAAMYDPEKIDLPDNIGIPADQEPSLRRKGVPAQLAKDVTREEWKKVWAAHLGLVTMADDMLGALLEELKAQGRLENTCVIVTADHGDHLGQHNMYQKMEMYEEAVRVPLVISLPGGRIGRIKEPVSHLDLKPTLCELAGANPGPCDGISLLPVLRGEELAPGRVVFSQYSGNPGCGTIRRCAISSRYKYIMDSAYDQELYDLEKDPHEMKNVAGGARYQEVVNQMRTLAENYHRDHGDYFDWGKKDELD